jgi:hypothetical protein
MNGDMKRIQMSNSCAHFVRIHPALLNLLPLNQNCRYNWDFKLLKAMENEKPEEFIPSKFEILPKTRK